MPNKCKQDTGYEDIGFGWQGKMLVVPELNFKEWVGCRQMEKKKVGVLMRKGVEWWMF